MSFVHMVACAAALIVAWRVVAWLSMLGKFADNRQEFIANDRKLEAMIGRKFEDQMAPTSPFTSADRVFWSGVAVAVALIAYMLLGFE